jgi:hypothetical protein
METQSGTGEPSGLEVTESAPTRAEARAAADRKVTAAYGTAALPTANVLHEISSGQLNERQEIVGEPVMWTPQVRYDGAPNPAED